MYTYRLHPFTNSSMEVETDDSDSAAANVRLVSTRNTSSWIELRLGSS